jgi:pyruvate/2-oxoglutarate dehydrogenase complex dihydrolipoamide dehydrogenase (E3) component
MATVNARKDMISGDDRRKVESWLAGMKGCTIVCAHARFESPDTVSVDVRLLEAERFFLDVGGPAAVPDLPGLSDIDYMTNVGLIELDKVPEHFVIIGAVTSALNSPRCTTGSVHASR